MGAPSDELREKLRAAFSGYKFKDERCGMCCVDADGNLLVKKLAKKPIREFTADATRGNTDSRWAPVSSARRVVQDGHQPLLLQQNATTRDSAQVSHVTSTKPWARSHYDSFLLRLIF